MSELGCSKETESSPTVPPQSPRPPPPHNLYNFAPLQSCLKASILASSQGMFDTLGSCPPPHREKVVRFGRI